MLARPSVCTGGVADVIPAIENPPNTWQFWGKKATKISFPSASSQLLSRRRPPPRAQHHLITRQ